MEIVTSQQSCTLEQNRGVIEEELSRAISEEKKHKFQGLLYVFDQLFLPVQDANAKTRIRSSIPFQEALEYFLTFQPHHSGAPSKYQRVAFREALLHEKHGLRINIICITEGFEYVALRPDEVDLESFLLDIFSACSTKSGHSALVLDKETVQGIVTTMDSEWDKICLRVILRSIFSREEMTALGFDPENLPSMTERVKFVVEEVKNANEAAADLVRLRLNSKKEKLEKEIKEKENLLQKKTNVWSSKTLEEIQSEVQKLKEKVEDTEGLLHSQPTKSNYQRKRQMLKHQASSLIESNRLKRRKLSNQGLKPKLDEEDEDFIAKAIEDKSSYHGRRHDTVLYTGQRVNKKNPLFNCQLPTSSMWEEINSIRYNSIQQGETKKQKKSPSEAPLWQRPILLEKATKRRRKHKRKHSLPTSTRKKHKKTILGCQKFQREKVLFHEKHR